MGLRYSAMLLLALVVAARVQAQPPAPLATIAIDVPEQCGGAVAFGERFGAKTASVKVMRGLSHFARGNLAPAYRPFSQIEIGFGANSSSIFQVTVTLRAASAHEADATAERIRDQFRTAGWVETGGITGRKPQFDPLGNPDGFNSDEGGLAAVPTGRRANVFVTGRDVNVACIDLPAFSGHAEAVFGPATPGEERPTPPSVVPAGVPLRLDCTRPLDELDAELADPIANPAAWLAAANRVNLYFEQLVAWNGRRMLATGAWTAEQKSEFALALLGHPDLQDEWAISGDTTAAMLSHLATAIQRHDAGNHAGACQAYNALFAELEGVPQLTMTFAATVDRLYAAEAARLGVTLE